MVFKSKIHSVLLPAAILLLALNASAQSRKVTAVSITVSNLERAEKFYHDVLTFNRVKETTIANAEAQLLFGISDNDMTVKVLEMQLGSETIQLMQFVNAPNAKAIPADSKSNDLWFQHIAIVVSDMNKAYDKLKTAKVTYVSSSPQTLPDYIPAASGISAFYFRDPDGHNLEVIYFPKEKGNPKWQQPTDKIFLGIDHTAIGIEETDRSLSFYQNALGLVVGGNSENYGPEQEHLNQVFGAHLLITGLHSDAGFGVEFLDYIAPPGGRQYPADSKPTDLWHWHITIIVDNANALYKTLSQKNYTMISNGVVTFNDEKSFIVRDPDGHAILLTEPKQQQTTNDKQQTSNN